MGITISSNNIPVIPVNEDLDTEYHNKIIYFKVDKISNQAIELSKDEYLAESNDSNPGYLYSYVYPESYIIQIWERLDGNVRIMNISQPLTKNNINSKYTELANYIVNNVDMYPDTRIDISMAECLDNMDIDYGNDEDSQLFKDKCAMFLQLLGIESDNINTNAEYCICAFNSDYYAYCIENTKEFMRYNNDNITDKESKIGKVVD